MFTPTPPRIPARHRPRGFTILHEDHDLLVVDKEPGVLTMSNHADNLATVEALLTRYLRKGNPRSRHQAWVVHRIDRATSGLLVFAKSMAVQQILKNNWDQTHKLYLAAVHGTLEEKSGELASYLSEDANQFVHTVAHRGLGTLARTAYTGRTSTTRPRPSLPGTTPRRSSTTPTPEEPTRSSTAATSRWA